MTTTDPTTALVESVIVPGTVELTAQLVDLAAELQNLSGRVRDVLGEYERRLHAATRDVDGEAGDSLYDFLSRWSDHADLFNAARSVAEMFDPDTLTQSVRDELRAVVGR